MTTQEQVKPASPTLDEGDHERMAHIVTPASAVTEALVTGGQVTALCGKRWTPSRSPEHFPVCKTCEEVLAHRIGGPL